MPIINIEKSGFINGDVQMAHNSLTHVCICYSVEHIYMFCFGDPF